MHKHDYYPGRPISEAQGAFLRSLVARLERRQPGNITAEYVREENWADFECKDASLWIKWLRQDLLPRSEWAAHGLI